MDKQYFRQGSTTVTTTGTAQTITIGFKPSYVRIINVDQLIIFEHFLAMGDGASFDTFSHADAQMVANTADSVTLTSNGFIMGTDICVAGADVLHWMAFR